ncbi:MAG: efflux transporter outer membrane subunit [Steroidobacteraceae bacterium]|jgi:NodT family efflux transporter outer membrane factor (OMF) lipoprotein
MSDTSKPAVARDRRSALALYLLMLCALALGIPAGCTVGPNFKAPAAPANGGFTPAGNTPAAATASAPLAGGEAQHFVDGLDIPGQWWTLFQSPELNALIERALKQNPTLESAQAALREANENVAAERGALLPSLSGNYEAQRNRGTLAEFGLPGAGGYYYTLNSANVSVSYTLDAFGGIRRQIEALQAQAEYARFSLEASYLTLTSNVVAAAITEASLRAQIAAQEDIARAQQSALDITQRRVIAGGASRTDVLQQQATLQATLATLPTLRTQLAQERDLLATYVGALPAEYGDSQFQLDTLKLPVELPVSLPSKFVEQRPDVRQYAALLHQTTAQVGVATANMLPQLTITGNYGGDAARFADLFSPASTVWGLAGSLTQPIFKGGQLMHQRRAAVAAAQEAAANYKATVLTAFQNVADALLALQGDADALAAQTTAERSAAGSLELVQAQYKAGGASYLQVLAAEQTYQNAAVALVKARAQRFTDTAALFQALGGGWWNRTDVAGNAPPKTQGTP